MKKRVVMVLGCAAVTMMMLLGGCSGAGEGTTQESDAATTESSAQAAVGSGESWAYIHESDAEVLRLGENGEALYKGKAYHYEKDDTYLTLTDEDGQSQKLRYVMSKGKLILYEKTEYHFVSGETSDDLIGLWQGGEEDRMSYEFTQKGTYLEDGVFPGHYLVDEEQGMIKLMYNDHFEDTYLYYTLTDGKLTIEYPWPMVPTTSEDSGR